MVPLTHMPFSLRWANARKSSGTTAAGASLDVRTIHDEHVELVWKSLLRLGVREADVEDVLQTVFMIVHDRLHTFDGSSKLTTWLFGICLRAAAAYRRKASHRREQGGGVPDETADGSLSAEEGVALGEARGRLRGILDAMDLDHRAVFVMFELDEMACDEIADIVGVPVGTVYSRLHSARRTFAAALSRFAAKDRMRDGSARGGRP